MKIAMIGQKIIPSRSGGIEIHVLELAKRMVKLGHEVDVICRHSHCEHKECLRNDRKYHCTYKGINIICVSNIKSKSLDAISYAFIATIKSLMKNYDVIHYHALGPTTMAILPKLLGKKVVATVHGLDWQRGKWGRFATAYLKFGEYASAKFAHETITVGEKLVKYYSRKYRKKISYIPNGIEKPVIKECNIINEKYGLKKDEYILFLARLVPEKGCHTLIEAYKKTSTKKKLIVAGGSSHSNAYEELLHDLGKDDERIVFTGFITGEILEELYSNSYCYILPSTIEGLPISLLEALSYGNCCLVSDIEENLSVIQTEENMFSSTFKVDNEHDLRNEIELLLNNENVVTSFKSKAASHVLEKYNWDDVVEETISVYSLLSN